MVLLLILSSCSLFISSVYAGCSQYAVVSILTTSVGSRATYTRNWAGIRRRAGTRYFILYSAAYSVKFQCCPGYSPLPDCPPVCSSCDGPNQNCSSPNNCVCISGWTGPSCNTDINECSLNTDQCDDPNGCINHPGTYSCHCTNPIEQIANDGHRCLGPVMNMVTVPGIRAISISWSPPKDYTADGIFRQYAVECHLAGSEPQSLQTFTTSTFIHMSSLLSSTSYTCCVTPEWTTDTGPVSCRNVVTLQDGPTSQNDGPTSQDNSGNDVADDSGSIGISIIITGSSGVALVFIAVILIIVAAAIILYCIRQRQKVHVHEEDSSVHVHEEDSSVQKY